MKVDLPVENGDILKAVQALLKTLVTSGEVEAVLTPMRTPFGTIATALVTDPDMLDLADPLAPVMPVNSATLAGQLSGRAPNAKVAVVMRSCELRALVELTKLRQASLENLLLVAVDCAGTYSVPKMTAVRAQHADAEIWQELFQDASLHPAEPKADLRPACKICEQPVFSGAQVSIELLGSDWSQGVQAAVDDDLASRLGLKESEHAASRSEVIERLIAARIETRDAEFAAMRLRLDGPDHMDGVFAACLRCHNCMNVCPICYCKTCVFKSAVFDHDPLQYLQWARQKGACRMPANTILFQLTRLNHMGLSCVGCGMCTEACPAELPVGLVFRTISSRLQETFGYVPGRKLDDPLPLVTFQPNEWVEVGE